MVWMTLTCVQGHSCLRNHKLLSPFSIKKKKKKKKVVDLVEITRLPQPAGLLNSRILHKKGRELGWRDFYEICLASSYVRTIVNEIVSNSV